VAELTNISLSRGAPSLDIVAVDDLKLAAQRAFEHDPASTFAYGTSAGYPRLLEWLSKKHAVEPDRLLATNGSMQADAFLFEELVEPGDVVVVEAPTYDRTLLSLTKLGAEVFPIPHQADGLDVCALQVALRSVHFALEPALQPRPLAMQLLEGLFVLELSRRIPKSHEILALVTFLGFYGGVLGLYVHRIRQAISFLPPALMVLLPLCAVGVSQLVLYFDQRDLGWVETSWRELGVPFWLSFAFWQWLAVLFLGLGIGYLLVARAPAEPDTPG
jgi:hypothetical protein